MSETNQTQSSDAVSFELREQSPPDIRLEDVRGLDENIALVKQTLLNAVQRESVDEYSPLRAVIHGRQGSGRTRFTRAVAGSLVFHGFEYSRIGSLNRSRATMPEFLGAVLEEAKHHEPLVLVLDCFADLDRDAPFHELADAIRAFRTEQRNVVLLADVPNGCLCRGDVAELFRAFDVHIEVPRPERPRRREILADEFERARRNGVISYDEASFDIDTIAVATDEFGVRELQTAVCRIVQDARASDGDQALLSTERALEVVTRVNHERIGSTCARNSIEDIDPESVQFDDIGGLSGAKDRLRELLALSQEWDDAFDEFGLSTTSGILLHGPPGNGKTMLAKAVANETDRTFISVAAPKLKNKFGHGIEGSLSRIFEKAERNAPSVVFFDEFDAIAHNRDDSPHKDDATSTLLTELDGIERGEDIVVIAATNRPDILDDAVLRPGRFEYQVEVSRPDPEEQREIFHIHTADLPLAADVTPEWCRTLTPEELSGAEIAAICRNAVVSRLRRADDWASADAVEVTQADFEWARERLTVSRRD